jgi:hypothetical protein
MVVFVFIAHIKANDRAASLWLQREAQLHTQLITLAKQTPHHHGAQDKLYRNC